MKLFILLPLLVFSSCAPHNTTINIIHKKEGQEVKVIHKGNDIKCFCGGEPNHIWVINGDIYVRCDKCYEGELAYGFDTTQFLAEKYSK